MPWRAAADDRLQGVEVALASPSAVVANLVGGRRAVGRCGTQHAAHGVVRGHVVIAVKLLRERIAEPWTLGSPAQQVHLSRSQLARAFNAATGASQMAYLRQMRVEQMARLLLGTDLSVAEAARAVGCKDPNYASRCFHPAGLAAMSWPPDPAVPSGAVLMGSRCQRSSCLRRSGIDGRIGPVMACWRELANAASNAGAGSEAAGWSR